jgi:hypothetical protein
MNIVLKAPTKGNPPACGAKNRNGTACRRPASANGRCNLHGGKALAGIASPVYSGKGRSRYVPKRWEKTYGEAIDDPDLLSLRPDLARVDAQIDEAVALLPDDGEEAQTFHSFLSHFAAARNFHRAANNPQAKEEERAEAETSFWQAFESASFLYQEGMQYRQVEADQRAILAELTESRRRLVDSETKRVTAAVQSMEVGQVRAILWALLDILRREIADKKALMRVQARFVQEFRALSGRTLSTGR